MFVYQSLSFSYLYFSFILHFSFSFSLLPSLSPSLSPSLPSSHLHLFRYFRLWQVLSLITHRDGPHFPIERQRVNISHILSPRVGWVLSPSHSLKPCPPHPLLPLLSFSHSLSLSLHSLLLLSPLLPFSCEEVDQAAENTFTEFLHFSLNAFSCHDAHPGCHPHPGQPPLSPHLSLSHSTSQPIKFSSHSPALTPTPPSASP